MLRAYLLAFFCHLVTKILADLHLGKEHILTMVVFVVYLAVTTKII